MADDAEIFYQADAANVNPNVLFVLDSSGSMNQDVPGSGGQSRMGVMQNTFREVLESSTDHLNVGLLEYANSQMHKDYHWGAIKGVGFPVSPIDAEAVAIIGGNSGVGNLPAADVTMPVRTFLADMVEEWEPNGYTPIVDSLYEATRYLRGEGVVWGKYPPEYLWSAHPSTYSGSAVCNNPQPQECRLDWGECNGTETGCEVRPVDTCCNWIEDSSGGYCENNDYSCSSDVTHCQHTTCENSSGNATYNSPIEFSCQPNFLVLMSDGKPEYPHRTNSVTDGAGRYPESVYPDRASDSTLFPDLIPEITSSQISTTVPALIGSGCADQPSGFASGTCGPELTQFLANSDQRISVEEEQTVETFTIAYGLADEAAGTSYLASLATATDGAYTAENGEELGEALSAVFEDIEKKSYSFASPSFSVSEDSLLSNGNDIYVPVFSSERTSEWPGNLRKLRLSSDNRIVGANNRSVFNASGQFLEDAQDLWSSEPHGADVSSGGVASRLPLPADRTLKTDAGGNALVDIHGDTPDTVITKEMMRPESRRTKHGLLDSVVNATGQPGADGLSSDGWYINCDDNWVTVRRPQNDPVDIKEVTTCSTMSVGTKLRKWLLNYARGYELTDNGKKPDLNTHRRHIGDISNSKPVIVNYENESLVFVGTNEGYLHAFDANSGVEQWAFMPVELLKNQLLFMRDSAQNRHVYGLDGPLTVWNYDANKDGEISSGSDADDRRMLFFGMRRGGNMYYALDITNPSVPKVSWKISPDSAMPGATTSGFDKLGETWSKPTISKMRVPINGGTETELKHVLVFGAGYDPEYDKHGRFSRSIGAALGADVYIVDAKTGGLLWSAKADGGNKASAMQHSVAGDIRILDMNNNGVLDRLYFADLGGNVWRADIGIKVDTSEVGASNAEVSYSNTTNLTKIAELGETSDGDGDHRKFFYEPDTALRMHGGEPIMTIAIGSGYRSHPLDMGDRDNFYVLLDRDVYRLRDQSASAVITHADLMEANPNGSGFGGSILDYPDKDGWYMPLIHHGEKVLSSSVTFLDKALFTTFAQADADGNPNQAQHCVPLETTGRAYALNVMTGESVADLNRTGGGNRTGSGNRTPFAVAAGTGEILDTPQLLFSKVASDKSKGCELGNCQQSVSVRVGKIDIPLLDMGNTQNDAGSNYSDMVDITRLLPRLFWRDDEVRD